MTDVVKRSAWYLLAPIASSGIAIGLLPIATRVLGPTEYGALAIVLSISSLCVAAGSAVLGYVLPVHLLQASGEKRQALLGSAVVGATAASLVVGIVIVIIIWVLPPSLEIGPQLKRGIAICVSGAVLGAPWQVCGEMLMLEGRASLYALGTVGQGIVNALTVLAFLYLAPLPGYALYLGNFAGQLFLFVFAMRFLNGSMAVPRTDQWYEAMRKDVAACSAAAAAENGRTLFERIYLGMWTTVSEVGLLTHAQLYRNWVMLGLNSVSKAVWPINLREAKVENPDFVFTNASWAVVQVGLASVCVCFALFGRELIAVLTNDKFFGAGTYALVLLCSLLIQTAGKPQMSLLVARGHGARYAKIVTLATIAGVAASALLVPYFGALGVAWAAVLQYALMRILIVRASKSLITLPFRDGWVLFGALATAGAYFWVESMAPSVAIRLLLFAVFGGIAIALVRKQWAIFLDPERRMTLMSDYRT